MPARPVIAHGRIVGVDPGARYVGIVALRSGELIRAEVLDRVALGADVGGYGGRILAGVAGTTRWQDVPRARWRAHVLERVAAALALLATGDPAVLAGMPLEEVAALAALDVEAGRIILGVEAVKAPHPHGGRKDGAAREVNPEGIIDTAVLAGAVLGRYPAAVEVAPAGFGAEADDAYPDGIRRRQRLEGGGPAQHARSAFDVAVAASWHARTGAAR